MSKKLREVLVIKDFDYHFTVWADAGSADAIREVEGVSEVFFRATSPTEYSVYLDARYDADSILADIDTALGD